MTDELVAGRSVKPTTPTIPSEQAPNFLALAKAFQGDHDFAEWHDLSQRGDKALRRKLFGMARTFIPQAREYRTEFIKTCKHARIKGQNIETMAVRFLFGPTLDKSLVHEWSLVGRYWYECSDEQDIEKAAERTITELKIEYRNILKAQKSGAIGAASVCGADRSVSAEAEAAKLENLWDVAIRELTDCEPNILITAHERDEDTDPKVAAYLSLQFGNGQEQLYGVPLSERGLREFIGLAKTGEGSTTTLTARWSGIRSPLDHAAE